jgi:pyrroline-5-carboxylate reductase
MRILFIGGGNMATALIGGLLQQGFKAGDIHVVEVSAQARERVATEFGVAASAGLDEGGVVEDAVLLAVKPQQMREVAQWLRPRLHGQLVVSIAAGIRTADLSRWLGGHGRIIRVMPNTPALVRAGISGLFAAPQATEADRENAQRILGSVGGVLWLDREEQMDGVTALSGSGPAYVFYFIEAMEQAAKELGFTEQQARTLAVATFAGAAKLAAGSDEPAAVLRARVTSKGGTTEQALKTMEAHDIKPTLVEAIHAAAKRSRELGDEFGKD